MRTRGKPGGVDRTQRATGSRASAAPAPASVAPDAVQVASTAQLLALAQEALAGVPDIRMNKVAAIRSRLDANDYSPDGEAVAEGLIKEHLVRDRRSEPRDPVKP